MATQRFGGIVSADFLEKGRSQGMDDRDIAQRMSESSPFFAEQLQKIQIGTNNNPKAVSALLNMRFYGDAKYSPAEDSTKKGFIGRSLDRIYQNYKKDILDIGTALGKQQRGEQDAFQTFAQTAGNVASIGYSPLSQPLQEGVETLAKGAYENIPGVKGVAQDIGQSEFVQKGLLPTIQSTAQFLSEESQRNPALASAGAVGEAIFDAGDAFLGGAIGKQAIKQGIPLAQKGISLAGETPSMIRGIPGAIGDAAEGTARAAGRGVGALGRGFMQGVRGTADDVAKATKDLPLSDVAKESIKAGNDEKVVRFIAGMSPQERKIASKMTDAAFEGGKKLEGTVAHKEMLGVQALRPLEHVVRQKEAAGKALGAMRSTLAGETVDLTTVYDDMLREMMDAGVVFNRQGKIVNILTASDDNIPTLQTIVDFLNPDDAGNVLRSFSEVDQWRRKIFAELGGAKAKLPYKEGQNVLDFADGMVGKARKGSLKQMEGIEPNFKVLDEAYARLSKEPADFLKKLGFKGKLTEDSLSLKDLKSGEVTLRTLGNASADTLDSYRKLLKVAQDYGYQSEVDVGRLATFTDALEDIFPISRPRSLEGGVARGVRDATGQFTEDMVRSGVKRAGINAVTDRIVDTINSFRGVTPENRFRLLKEMLDAPDDAKFFSDAAEMITDAPNAADDVLEIVEGHVKESVETAIE